MTEISDEKERIHTIYGLIGRLPTANHELLERLVFHLTRFDGCDLLTPSKPAVPNCCCLKGLAPYWSYLPFLIFDIRVL